MPARLAGFAAAGLRTRVAGRRRGGVTGRGGRRGVGRRLRGAGGGRLGGQRAGRLVGQRVGGDGRLDGGGHAAGGSADAAAGGRRAVGVGRRVDRDRGRRERVGDARVAVCAYRSRVVGDAHGGRRGRRCGGAVERGAALQRRRVRDGVGGGLLGALFGRRVVVGHLVDLDGAARGQRRGAHDGGQLARGGTADGGRAGRGSSATPRCRAAPGGRAPADPQQL